ncbi:MAG: hydroxyacylglutathione hydrolase [Paracoccaceae bacterium]|nr:hydroxyacylglutathione hydrolase [Paracoccaceae bacterium]
MKFQYHQFKYGSDNYGVLVHDTKTKETVAVDAGNSTGYLNALKEMGWSLTQIWITHHHGDHTDGLSDLKKQTGAKVFGPKSIEYVDVGLSEGDQFEFSGEHVRVLETPGHTLDMLNFYLKSEETIFTGDTLFVMGCGRLFEGSAEQMYNSISKLLELPRETIVYCSHEYTLANAKFALSVDPENIELINRYKSIEVTLKNGLPTVPTTIKRELQTNPFCRFGDIAIRRKLGMIESSDSSVFKKLRELKDSF